MEKNPANNGGAKKSGTIGELFGLVAFWQGIGFFTLLCLIWAIEAVDLPYLLYDVPQGKVDWFGSCLLTAGVIVMGFVIVGQTFLQQKRVLRGFIRVCSYCRKVHVNETDWELLEAFISERTMAEFTHGICPICYRKVMAEIESDDKKLTDSTKEA